MRERAAYTILALSAAGLLACTGARAQTTGLLRNPGPSFLGGLTLARNADGAPCHVQGSSFAEIDALGDKRAPGGSGTPRDCAGGTLPGTTPSYYHDTRVGWFATDAGIAAGWSIDRVDGGGGTPITWRYRNAALEVPSSCTLREVGLVYQGWGDKRHTALRLNPDGTRIKVGQFRRILGSFRARIVDEAGPPRCRRNPTAYVTADFRIAYFASEAAMKPVRSDLVGVLVHAAPPGGAPSPARADMNGNPADDVFYASRGNVLLHGDRLPIGLPPLGRTKATPITIDYAPLLARLPPPPPGFSRADAVIVGFDLYAAVRGASITFDLSDVALRGER